MKKTLTLTILFMLSGILMAGTLATVGPYVITDKDVKNSMDDMKRSGVPANMITKEFALSSLIDIKLGIMDAKNQMIDKEPRAIDAMDSALYVYYMNKVVDASYRNKVFSNKEILNYYQNNPLVKIQRLTYAFNKDVPANVDKARTQMNIIRGELKSKKITFEAALEKTADRSIPGLTGVFDKVIVDDLAPQEAMELKLLKPLEISGVIQGGKFFAITRIIKVYPYTPEYADDINERLKDRAIISARGKFTKNLREKYATIIKVNK